MFCKRKNLFGLVIALATALLPGAVLAQAKVAVVDSVQAPARLKQGVRQAVAAALDDLSVGMVPIEDVRAGDLACADAVCFVSTAQRLAATHVLLVQGVANPAGYRLSLDLRDGETGRSLGTDGKDCELCAEDQFAPTIRDRVTKLWMRVMKESAPVQASPSVPAATTPSVQRPGVDVSSIPPWYEQPRPVVGLGLAAAGLAAIGVGIYYIAVDGNASESSAIQNHAVIQRDTQKWGWTLIGMGGVAALAGTSMFVWGRDDGTQVEVVMNPTSVGLHGKF